MYGEFWNVRRVVKELSFRHKLKFLNPYIFATRCSRPLIFQTMNYVRSNSLKLKYYRFKPSGCKDIGIRKCEFVAKTQFLYTELGTFILWISRSIQILHLHLLLICNLIIIRYLQCKLKPWRNNCNKALSVIWRPKKYEVLSERD